MLDMRTKPVSKTLGLEDALREEKQFKALGCYEREIISNLDNSEARLYFNMGLRRLFGYHHQEAIKYFKICQKLAPDCALSYAFMALCHCPNYNFSGEAYYSSTNISNPSQYVSSDGDIMFDKSYDPEENDVFPCQESAFYYARMASEIVKRLNKKKTGKKKRKSYSQSRKVSAISEKECHIISAIQHLTKHPSVSPERSEKCAGRPYADFLRKVYHRYENDPDIAYLYAESLMNLNAWNLYEFPSAKTRSPDVDETRRVLEKALLHFPDHAGLCHVYIHLCEMSPNPGAALAACMPLRTKFPRLGHLIHMPTHIDVLVGDYESCVHYNLAAIESDMMHVKVNPDSSGVSSFYFGYIMHNFHMLVYGCILGAMEEIGMKTANELNSILNEDLFAINPDLAPFIESYSAMEVHLMVRFGRWEEILQIPLPNNKELMLYRSVSIYYARAIAYAVTGDISKAKREADLFDKFSQHPSAKDRLLHNNIISRIFEADAPMMRGEIAYKEGKYDEAFSLLRKAVTLQDSLKYDEPWGKMQPVRHALGGILLEQNQVEEAEMTFRTDLKKHPKNPWSTVGLINCLKKKYNLIDSCCGFKSTKKNKDIPKNVTIELKLLHDQLIIQRNCEWADFDVTRSCLCCKSDEKQASN